jgi:hypothetical protein
MATTKAETTMERDGSWDAPPPAERTGALGNAPWWLISMGLHAVILITSRLVSAPGAEATSARAEAETGVSLSNMYLMLAPRV